MRGLVFHTTTNEQLLCYSKSDEEKQDIVLVVVNMDYHHSQSGMVEFSPAALGLPHSFPFVVHDVLTDERFTWTDYWNYVELDPRARPAHLFRVELPEA
jgi:starch synthase (maltosyl-transferring)